MARQVVWSQSASADLIAIAEYISRDSEFYATSVVRELVAAAASLALLAERGRQVPEYSEPAIRELFVRRYRLIYRVGSERVEVVRIIHGAQDMPQVG